MQIPHQAVLLRILIGESDRWEHKPLYEAIVLKAREQHLAGATVLRGPMGFGKSSRLHTAKILRLSMDLPLLIEIVDSEEKIQAFLPVLDEMLGGGRITLQQVQVIEERRTVDKEAGPRRAPSPRREVRGPVLGHGAAGTRWHRSSRRPPRRRCRAPRPRTGRGVLRESAGARRMRRWSRLRKRIPRPACASSRGGRRVRRAGRRR